VQRAGSTYEGLQFSGKVCGVSIMRAGEAMEKALRDCCRYVTRRLEAIVTSLLTCNARCEFGFG